VAGPSPHLCVSRALRAGPAMATPAIGAVPTIIAGILIFLATYSGAVTKGMAFARENPLPAAAVWLTCLVLSYRLSGIGSGPAQWPSKQQYDHSPRKRNARKVD